MKHCEHTGCENPITRECYGTMRFWQEHRHCDQLQIINVCWLHTGHLTPVRNDSEETVYQLQLINLKLHKMSQTGDDLKALVTRLTGSLEKIKVDVGTLAGAIPEGGLSAAEAAELKTQLLGVVDEAAAIDALTSDPVTPPTV